MYQFDFNNPVKLAFGRGNVNKIGKITGEYGKKALVVSYNTPSFTSLLERVYTHLKEEGLEYVVFNEVQQNPLTTTVTEGAKLANSEGCDVIIGIGGGSAMDTAKGIAFSAVNEGDISDYIFGKPGTGALPIILINTTAGTGSEGNSTAVFTNPETNNKKGLVTPLIYPKVSIIDPELMTTLPKKVIAAPGLDVLFHAIESYISKKSNPISEIYALKAIELVSQNLVTVYNDPSNLDAWDKVTLANTLAGMAIGCSGTTLPHAMQHPLGGLLNIVHAEGLAALYIPILEYTYPAATEKFANIAAAMGIDIRDISTESAALKAIAAVKNIIEKVNMNVTLTELGTKEEHLEWLTNNTLTLMRVVAENNPKVPTKEDVYAIYKKCL